MSTDKIGPGRGTLLRKNDSKLLTITIKKANFNYIILINGSSLLSKNIDKSYFRIPFNEYYMIINKSNFSELEIFYDHDISTHKIIYDPYKYENSKKNNLKAHIFIKQFNLPEDYIDILSKWYSIKFSYLHFNLIFIKPGLGMSFQVHKSRNEEWEILEGQPIIIAGNHVYYNVKKGKKFKIPKNTIHSVINPNNDEYVLIKEFWTGKFDEGDITRIFNPNNYE